MNHPIVVLHGWGLSANVYDNLAAELRKQHLRVFAPDFPTDKPRTLSDFVAFLDTFLKKNHINRPILLGHSFGGRVALKYEYEHPGNVSALILTGTPGFTPVAKKKLAVLVALAKIGKILLPFDSVRRWYYYVTGARDYYRATPPMRETFKNIVRESLVEYMRAVQVPTLLVWGGNDNITPVWIGKKMNDSIPRSKLIVIPDSDHGVSYKKPKDFLAAIYDFLFTLA